MLEGSGARAATSWIACAIALATGCAPSEPPLGTHRSGTRLRARVQILDDGTRRFVGWYDTELEMPCFFGRIADGTYRCMPTTSLREGYADRSCTVRAHLHFPCEGALPRFASYSTVSSYDECELYDPEFEAFELDPSLAAPAHARHGECVATEHGEIAVPASPASTSSFVAARIVRRPLTARLAATYFVAADGAEQLRDELFDLVLERPCVIEETGGRLHCVPRPLAFAPSGRHASPDCSDRLAISPLEGCRLTPVVVREASAGACGASVSLHEVAGPSVPGYETLPDGTCVESPPSPSTLYLSIGPRVADGFLAEGALGARGGGRARVRTVISHGTSDGALIGERELIDERGERCEPAVFADGTTRCVSGVAWRATRYADPECTEPLVPAPGAAPACPGRSIRFGVRASEPSLSEPGTSCDPVIEALFRLEAAPAGPRYVIMLDGECREIPDDDAIELERAEEIAFDVFPELREAIE